MRSRREAEIRAFAGLYQVANKVGWFVELRLRQVPDGGSPLSDQRSKLILRTTDLAAARLIIPKEWDGLPVVFEYADGPGGDG
jgi:hypothetical protein